MGQELSSGNYIEYPCVNGCGHHMRLKDDISDLADNDSASLECPNCEQEKEYSVAELNGIINS